MSLIYNNRRKEKATLMIYLVNNIIPKGNKFLIGISRMIFYMFPHSSLPIDYITLISMSHTSSILQVFCSLDVYIYNHGCLDHEVKTCDDIYSKYILVQSLDRIHQLLVVVVVFAVFLYLLIHLL